VDAQILISWRHNILASVDAENCKPRCLERQTNLS